MKTYIKQRIVVYVIDDGTRLMAASGIDKQLHDEVKDPSQQLAKPDLIFEEPREESQPSSLWDD